MKTKQRILFLILVPLLTAIGLWFYQYQMNYNVDHISNTEGAYFVQQERYEVGDVVDSLNGVYVYYNGSVNHTKGESKASDGYVFGMKYQASEFIKRYYYDFFNHKISVDVKEAEDYFIPDLTDGEFNTEVNLIQYKNPSLHAPKENDILIYYANSTHQKGYLAIVSKVEDERIEVIHQNPGWVHPSRERYALKKQNDEWKIDNGQVIGWLRKK